MKIPMFLAPWIVVRIPPEATKINILLFSSTLPPSPRMVSFDWNNLVDPFLPSSSPFQIMVKVNSKGIY
jgi:hypothetical protein